jgi:hypothetical protein
VSSHAPVIVIELLLVLGGALAFGWWQLRELKKLRQQRRDAETAQTAQTVTTQPPADDDRDH